MNHINMRAISADNAKSVMNMRDVINITRNVYKRVGNGKIVCPPKVSLELPGNDGHHMNWINSMPALLADENIVGLKWVNVTSRNRDINLPVTIGTIILNDATTGVPLAVVDGTWITHMRTGASVAIGAEFFARRNSEVMTIIGAGSEGRSALEAIMELFDIKRVHVVDINTKSAENFIKTAADKYPKVEFKVQTNPKDSAGDSDMIILTTTARHPIFMKDWAKPGDFICTISCMTDLDFGLIDHSNKFVVDDMHCTLLRISAMAGLKLDASRVHGDICQIAAGKKTARENDKEIITYTPSGMGAVDLAVALEAYRKSKSTTAEFSLL